jgi:RNA polymerase sigma-70 factor (ECF subfamily)
MKTSLTLLQNAQTGSSDAWTRLDAIYRPYIRGWFRYRSVPEDDAEDLTQQVLLVLSRELPTFKHTGRTGAFRRWLKCTAIFEEKVFWRKRSAREKSAGGSDFQMQARQIKDDDELNQYWDEEHDRYVLQKILDEISADFEVKTLAAFQRFAIEGESIESVSADLEMSIGAIYVAKSLILKRLRAEAKGLVD